MNRTMNLNCETKESAISQMELLWVNHTIKLKINHNHPKLCVRVGGGGGGVGGQDLDDQSQIFFVYF
jgi:hypothetical protein